MYYIVYDNFLNSQEYGTIKQYLDASGGYPWKLSGRINNNDENNGDMYFATLNYHSYEGGWLPDIRKDVFQLLTSKLYIESLFRIKSNLYFPSRSGKVEHHAKHRDTNFKHQGALFYLTTCDAPTTMADGTEIEAVENRLLLFDPTSMHSSSSPTNAPYRITININYFGSGVIDGYKDAMPNPIPVLSYNKEKVNDLYDV